MFVKSLSGTCRQCIDYYITSSVSCPCHHQSSISSNISTIRDQFLGGVVDLRVLDIKSERGYHEKNLINR